MTGSREGAVTGPGNGVATGSKKGAATGSWEGTANGPVNFPVYRFSCRRLGQGGNEGGSTAGAVSCFN